MGPNLSQNNLSGSIRGNQILLEQIRRIVRFLCSRPNGCQIQIYQFWNHGNDLTNGEVIWHFIESDECSWYDERHPSTGEICVNGTRRVLNLEGNNLVGSLPPEIGMLSNLGALNLAGNELVGPLPSEIGFLTALRAFIVYNNKWTGTIPTSVGLMTELRVFDIDNAALDGE